MGFEDVLDAVAATYKTVTQYGGKSDRIFIADSLRAGWSLRKIAAELGRPASTISREVPRNSHPRSDDYGPYAAHDRAIARLP